MAGADVGEVQWAGDHAGLRVNIEEDDVASSYLLNHRRPFLRFPQAIRGRVVSFLPETTRPKSSQGTETLTIEAQRPKQNHVNPETAIRNEIRPTVCFAARWNDK